MNRSLFRFTAYLQIAITIGWITGCAQTQPYYFNESPDLHHYLDTATSIEYPDVEVESLPETTEALPPLSIGNHDYQFWDLTLEECVNHALQNAKFFTTTSGNAEFRQNIAAQFTSGTPDQFGSVYDVAIQQSTTQSVPLTVDGNGNRTLPRGVLRANQIGGVEDALAEFDAHVSAFINYSTTDRPRNTGAGNTVNPPIAVATDTTQQSAISKRFATGGVATIRQQLIYARNNAVISNFSRSTPSDWTALVEAQVQHPLMRNRGTYINRIPVVLASLNEDQAIADFEIQVRNLVRDVENAYWDLYVAYRNVSTRIIGRNSAIATADLAKKNMIRGLGTLQEFAQAREQYFQFRGQLEASLAGSNIAGDERFGVYGRERVLRELMGISATDGRLIRPVEEPSIARVEYDWNESVAQMLHMSPELRRSKIRIKQSELELDLAKNQVLPDVNLSLLYRFVGVGDHLGPPNGDPATSGSSFPGSSALAGVTNGRYQEGAIRLDFAMPVGLRRELTRIKGSRFRLKREKEFLQDQERLQVSQLSDAFAKVKNHYQLLQTNAQRWLASEEEVESRLAQFRHGKGTMNTVLQSQLRRAEAQIAYYRALGEYNKSINYVDYLRGTMLANSGITLEEGPWNDKAYWDALERARERSSGIRLPYGVTRPEVIRRGPLSEQGVIGSGIEDTDQSVLQKAEELGLSLSPYRDSVDVNDQPLTAYEKPADLISLEGADTTTLEEPVQNETTEVVGSGAIQSSSVIQSSYQSETEYSPEPVRRKRVPGPQ